MFWASRLSPLPYRQIKAKKEKMAGTSLDVSSDISVSCKPLRWAGTCMDNQPPSCYETRSEGINYFKQPLETGCDPTQEGRFAYWKSCVPNKVSSANRSLG